MENYIVSARKYRPQSFSTLIGQDAIATTLKNSIQRGQLAHAYLFCGPRGVGKTTSARIFARIINCSNPGPDMEPCGRCESCESFAQGRSYCIHELDAASNNSVDDIRELTDKVQIPPQIGRYSVYIIDEVHMLSQAAFNAFLKTLEEPPEYAIFILATTEKHKILPTILSRCQTYDFKRIGVEDIVRNLRSIAAKESVSIDDESMHVIALKADGAMRDALTLFDQTVAFCGNNISYAQVIKNLNVLDYDYYFNIVRSSLSGQYAKSLLLFDEVLAKGFNAQYFVSGLSSHIRNLLVCKDSSTAKLLECSRTIAAKYVEQASLCSVKYLFDALTLTTKCESEYRNSPSQRLLVEFLLVKLASLAAPLPETISNIPPAIVPKAAPAPVPAAVPKVPAPAAVATTPVPAVPAAVAQPSPEVHTPAIVPAPASAPVHAAVSKVPAPAAVATTPVPAVPAAVAQPSPEVHTPAIVPEPAPAAAAVVVPVSVPEVASSAAVEASPAVVPATAPATVPSAVPETAHEAVVAAAPAVIPASVPAAAPSAVPEIPVVEPAVETIRLKMEDAGSEPKKVSAGMSISGMLGSMSIDEEEQAKAKAEAEHSSRITGDGLAKAWLKMTEDPQVSRYPNLVAAIKATNPRIKENGTTIVFPVTNSAQKSWIEKKILLTLEGILKETLNNSALKLLVEMNAPGTEEKPRAPYMPVEKDAHLRREFPEYAQFKKELELDLK